MVLDHIEVHQPVLDLVDHLEISQQLAQARHNAKERCFRIAAHLAYPRIAVVAEGEQIAAHYVPDREEVQIIDPVFNLLAVIGERRKAKRVAPPWPNAEPEREALVFEHNAAFDAELLPQYIGHS